jgi:hypothetical protein
MVSISSLFRFFFIFAVLTVAGIWFLFDEMSFLWLAILNAVVLGFVWLIVRFSKSSTVVPVHTKHHKEVAEEIIEEKEESKDEDESTSTKPSHHAHHQQFVKYTYNHKKKKKSVLIWLLVALGLVSAFYLFMSLDFSSSKPEVNDSLSGYAEDILAQDDLSGDIVSGDIVESTGEVLSTGSIGQSTWVTVDKSFVTTWETPKTAPVVSEPKLSTSTLKFTDTQSVSLLEAVVYLLQTHNTTLYTKKDVKFSGVTTANKYYAYWYTAYKMWLVGKVSNPTSLVSCQTYIVLKWMLEKWNVQYTSTNIKTQFWAEAQKNNLLNGCVFGKTLKGANLD